MPNEQIISYILASDAFERFKRIQTYHKQKSEKIEAILVNLYYSGRIKAQINDEDFVKIVQSAEEEKNDVKIKIDRRKRDFDLDDL